MMIKTEGIIQCNAKSIIACAYVLFELLLAGFVSQPAVGGEANAEALSKLTITQRSIALLGGRLRIRMPESARVEQRGHNIMAGPEADEDETRIVLDAGKERLVLMAYELYSLISDNLEKAARTDIAEVWGKEAERIKLEKINIGPQLGAIVVIPPLTDGKDEANLVLACYVGNADGTVQYLAFYVNPAGANPLHSRSAPKTAL